MIYFLFHVFLSISRKVDGPGEKGDCCHYCANYQECFRISNVFIFKKKACCHGTCVSTCTYNPGNGSQCFFVDKRNYRISRTFRHLYKKTENDHTANSKRQPAHLAEQHQRKPLKKYH